MHFLCVTAMFYKTVNEIFLANDFHVVIREFELAFISSKRRFHSGVNFLYPLHPHLVCEYKARQIFPLSLTQKVLADYFKI